MNKNIANFPIPFQSKDLCVRMLIRMCLNSQIYQTNGIPYV